MFKVNAIKVGKMITEEVSIFGGKSPLEDIRKKYAHLSYKIYAPNNR